jgi:hypothetical protein
MTCTWDVVKRNGVLVSGEGVMWAKKTRTRRGAQRLFLELHDRLPTEPGLVLARPSTSLLVTRIERGRVAETWELPGGNGPDIGVREPRRPRPSGGGASAAVDPAV